MNSAQLNVPLQEPVDWSAEGAPRSPRFDDVYRTRVGGLAQAQAVFLAGCRLPQAWQALNGFTVLETGFGLGLNFLATWAAWERDPARCPQLHYVAIEAYPVAAVDIVRSAQACTEPAPRSLDDSGRLVPLAQRVAQAWESLRPGMQTFSLAQGRVQLTLAIGDVAPMLKQIDCVADAVYLDGFSPARNPQMWSPETMLAIARHCRPGSALATYSAAGPVRAALRSAGFVVRRRPGLPPKWHRLEARFIGVDAGGGPPATAHIPA